MPELIVGPMLRHIGETTATVWVETDEPCEVEILGSTAETFTVEDHHYAIVAIDGHPIGEGTPGPVGRSLRSLYADHLDLPDRLRDAL